jgi:hypothetical protein
VAGSISNNILRGVKVLLLQPQIPVGIFGCPIII